MNPPDIYLDGRNNHPHLALSGIFCIFIALFALVTDAKAEQPAKARLQDGTAASRSFEPPFPFDSAKLWSQLAQVTALHGQDLTAVRIESIFGVKLRKLKGVPINSKALIFAVRAHEDWYYDLDFMVEKSTPIFVFGWGQIPGSKYQIFPQPSANICVRSSLVARTLYDQGWRLSARDRSFDIPNSDYYKFDTAQLIEAAQLRVDFDRKTDCLLGLDLTGRPAT